MSKRVLLVFLGIFVLCSLPALFEKRAKKLISSASEITSAYAFKPSEIEDRLKKIEAALPDIEQAVAQHRYQEGRALFDKTFHDLRRSQHDAGNATLAHGRTLGGELDRLASRIGAAARRDFEALVADIAKGGADTATVHRLAANFSNLGGNDFDQDLAARAAGIDRTRRTLAGRWIRINIEAANETYEKMIVDHVLKTLVPPSGFTLVFGPPIGPAEAEATFCTVTLNVIPDVQNYSVQFKGTDGKWSNDFYHDKESNGLLAGLRVQIRLHNAFPGYLTTWDTLPGKSGDTLTIDLDLPTPASFDFQLERGREPHDEFVQRNVPRLAAIKTKLAAALAALPPLDFAPEKNSAPDPLSRQNALANPAGFTQAASASLAAKKPAGDIACIAVELMLEPLAEPIEKQFDKLALPERYKLAQTLALHPWYHGYNTLNKLFLSTQPNDVGCVVKAMQRDLDQELLRKTVVTRMLREKAPGDQLQMVDPLVMYCPPENLPDLVRLYPTLQTRSQSALLTSLMKRDRAIAAPFGQQLIKAGKPEVVSQVCDAVGDALTSINSSRKMVLQPDEIALFSQAVGATRGAQRAQIISRMPCCEELLVQLLQGDRSSWTEMENLELYSQFNGPLPRNGKREVEIMGAVFNSVKQGRLNTPPLAQKASSVLSTIANNLLRTRGDEQVKIPLILAVIDERSPEKLEICSQSVTSMIATLSAPGVLAHPDARTLLTKARSYPNDRTRQDIRTLTADAAKIDPSYRDLL